MIERIFKRCVVAYLWFVAGALFGYIWMAKAYGLF